MNNRTETSFFGVDELNEELNRLPDAIYEELLNTVKSLSQEMIMMKAHKKTAIRPAKRKLNEIRQLSKQLSELIS